MVSPESDGELWCQVEGNPLSEDHVTWKWSNPQNLDQRTEMFFRNNTSHLVIHSVTKDDIGTFQCVANNGLGNQSIKDAFLIVKRKYLCISFY